jgi:hypothetical protein
LPLSPPGLDWQRCVVLRDGFWSDPSASDWIASAGGLAGFTALVIELLRSRRRRKRPPAELVGYLVELHGWFQAVLVHGGRNSQWFEDPERPRREVQLAAIAGQLIDRNLHDLVSAARAAWLDCVMLVPDPGVRHSEEARQRQLDTAKMGMRTTAKALDRANRLMRKSS